jgi:hypothetical protein
MNSPGFQNCLHTSLRCCRTLLFNAITWSFTDTDRRVGIYRCSGGWPGEGGPENQEKGGITAGFQVFQGIRAKGQVQSGDGVAWTADSVQAYGL